MSGLFSSPSIQQPKPVQVQAGAVETDAANAGMFERLQRARAYGAQKTRMFQDTGTPALERKTLLGGV